MRRRSRGRVPHNTVVLRVLDQQVRLKATLLKATLRDARK